MILEKIRPADVPMVYSWLVDPQNSQWLEFEGGGLLGPVQLQLMIERETHYLRLFKPSWDSAALGLVALSNINRTFGTAMPWCVLGSKSHTGKFYTAHAVSKLLQVAFGDLGLRSLHAWTVETNIPSIKLLRHAGFRFIGRQRRCHVIRDQVLDRLWFDLLNSEYRESIAGYSRNSGVVRGATPVLEFPRVPRNTSA
jgi:RimJ/RimL family protein N-acetyltransferase